MLIYAEQSRNVYENKRKVGKMSDQKADNCYRLRVIVRHLGQIVTQFADEIGFMASIYRELPTIGAADSSWRRPMLRPPRDIATSSSLAAAGRPQDTAPVPLLFSPAYRAASQWQPLSVTNQRWRVGVVFFPARACSRIRSRRLTASGSSNCTSSARLPTVPFHRGANSRR